MLISGPSPLNWGRRTTTTIMAIGSGLWYRAGRGHGDQAGQPRSGRAGLAAGPAVPTGAAPGVPSPDQLPPQQRPAAPRRPASAPVTPAEVRAWARTQGLPVADRGPVPSWVMDHLLGPGGPIRTRAAQGSRHRPCPPHAPLDVFGRLTPQLPAR